MKWCPLQKESEDCDIVSSNTHRNIEIILVFNPFDLIVSDWILTGCSSDSIIIKVSVYSKKRAKTKFPSANWFFKYIKERSMKS